MTELEKTPSNPWRKLKIRNTHARECLAEFLGTFVLLALGEGAVAQAVLSNGELGSVHSIHWAWGIAVMMAIYVAIGVSGAHLNPAVTLAHACIGRLAWRKTPGYMLAQYAGAFVASPCVYLVYYDALQNFDGGIRHVGGDKHTAGIYATYPQPYTSAWNGLGDQVFGTAMLLLCVLAITDPRNAQPSKAMTGVNSCLFVIFGTAMLLLCVLAITDPRNAQASKSTIAISIGLFVVAIGMSFGVNCGYAINPARDLSPRIFTSIAGWGIEPFKYREYNYFWIPIVGPYIGGVIGAFIYQLFVGFHWPDEEVDTPTSHVTPPTHTCDSEKMANGVQYDGPYITDSL